MALNTRYIDDSRPTVPLNDIQREGIRAFNGKEYTMIKRDTCPVCDGTNFETLSEKDRYGLRLNVIICTSCGLVFANPYFDEGSLKRFYNEDSPVIYRGHKEDTREGLDTYFDKKRAKGEKIYNFLLEHHRPIKDMVVAEVGCASGGILQIFKEKGNEVTGVDFGEDYVAYGREKGLQLYVGDITELVRRGVRADVLIYTDVLEHIPDIDAELRYARSVLKDNGVLYIGVPSVHDIESNAFGFLGQLQNAHVYYFSLATLNNAMQKHGFTLYFGEEKRGVHALYQKGSARSDFVNAYRDIKNHLLKDEARRQRFTFGIFNTLKTPIRHGRRVVKALYRRIKNL